MWRVSPPQMSRLMTKPTKWHVRPAKTQISLGIRQVWSESLLSAWRKLGSLATHWAHSEDWSDWADAQADLSLRWVQRSFCWFCHEAAQMYDKVMESIHDKLYKRLTEAFTTRVFWRKTSQILVFAIGHYEKNQILWFCTLYQSVFQVSRPYLGFCPDPKHFIVNFEENIVTYAGKWWEM